MKSLLTVLLLVSTLWAQGPGHREWTRVIIGWDHVHGGHSIFAIDKNEHFMHHIDGAAIKASMNDANNELWILNALGYTFFKNKACEGQGWVHMGTIPGGGPIDICANGYLPAVITWQGLYVRGEGGWTKVRTIYNAKAIAGARDGSGVYVLNNFNLINKYGFDGTLLSVIIGPTDGQNMLDISVNSANTVHVTGYDVTYQMYTMYGYHNNSYWVCNGYSAFYLDFVSSHPAKVLLKGNEVVVPPRDLRTIFRHLGVTGGEVTGPMNNIINDIAIGDMNWHFYSNEYESVMRDGLRPSNAKNDIPIMDTLKVK